MIKKISVVEVVVNDKGWQKAVIDFAMRKRKKRVVVEINEAILTISKVDVKV